MIFYKQPSPTAIHATYLGHIQFGVMIFHCSQSNILPKCLVLTSHGMQCDPELANHEINVLIFVMDLQ